MAEQDVVGSARIAAPAGELYDLVTDVRRMGDWSPENIGGRWLEGASGPAVGAKFSGANRRGWRRWSTTCTVVAAEAGQRFAFDVDFAGVPVSRWTYDFRPEGDGTVVTETWTDRRAGWFALAARPLMGVADLRSFHEENIRKTLTNLKSAAERRSTGQV